MRFISVFLVFLWCSVSFAADMASIGLNGLINEIGSNSAKTMVVFWAPWCPHCKRELKILRDNPQFVANNKLQVICLTKAKDKKRAEDFVADEKMPYKFFLADQAIYDKYQKIDAVPLTLIFDRSGKVLDFEYGKQNIEDLALMLED